MLTWRNVPGYFDFQDIYADAVARAPADGAHFVEVGVLFGKSMLFMAEAIRASGKHITFDAVDRFGWSPASVVKQFNELPRDCDEVPGVKAAIAEAGLEKLVRTFLQLAGLADFANLVVATGQERARAYPDASLDFVFLDADHGYQDTVELLRAYLPKMKTGGALAGHDFGLPGVAQAVDEVLSGAVQRGTSFVCEIDR